MPVSMPPKTGGKKRRTRGGNVIAQAIVPASLVLMNNAFGKNSRKRH
jgi:ribosomal protein S6E (S10)